MSNGNNHSFRRSYHEGQGDLSLRAAEGVRRAGGQLSWCVLSFLLWLEGAFSTEARKARHIILQMDWSVVCSVLKISSLPFILCLLGTTLKSLLSWLEIPENTIDLKLDSFASLGQRLCSGCYHATGMWWMKFINFQVVFQSCTFKTFHL